MRDKGFTFVKSFLHFKRCRKYSSYTCRKYSTTFYFLLTRVGSMFPTCVGNIPAFLLTLGARMRSEGYGTWSVRLSVSTYSRTTGTKLAHEQYQRLQRNKRSKTNVANSLKRRCSGSRNRHCRGPRCVTEPINYK